MNSKLAGTTMSKISLEGVVALKELVWSRRFKQYTLLVFRCTRKFTIHIYIYLLFSTPCKASNTIYTTTCCCFAISFSYRFGQVSCGLNHTMCVSADGSTVWAFGDGDYGKLGIGSTAAKSSPQVR